MKIETILNAMIIADRRRISVLSKYTPNAQRQYHAFRNRILRMFEELRFDADGHSEDCRLAKELSDDNK